MTVDEIDRALTVRLGRPADALHVASSIGRGLDRQDGETIVREIHRTATFRATLLLHPDEDVAAVRRVLTDGDEPRDGIRVLMVDIGSPSIGRLPVTIEGRVA